MAVTASLSHINAIFLFAEGPQSMSQGLYFLCGRYCKDSVLHGTNQVMHTRVVSACFNSLDHRMQF